MITFSTFNEKAPYESLDRFTSRHCKLSNEMKREFWDSIQKFFAEKAFNDEKAAPSTEQTRRVFEVNLPQLFAAAQAAGVKNIGFLKAQLLANIYKVAGCHLPIGCNPGEMKWGVYQIWHVDHANSSAPVRWGWINEIYVSDELRTHLDEERGIIKLKDISPTELLALQGFQKYLSAGDYVLEIPANLLLDLLAFTMRWQLDNLRDKVWSTLYFIDRSLLSETQKNQVYDYCQKLSVPEPFLNPCHLVESKPRMTTSPYFDQTNPYESTRRFAKRCCVLTPESQFSFVKTVQEFFHRSAYLGDLIPCEKYPFFLMRDIEFLNNATSFTEESDKISFRDAVLAVADTAWEKLRAIKPFTMSQIAYADPDLLHKQLEWLHLALIHTTPNTAATSRDYRHLLMEEWIVPESGDPLIFSWVDQLLKLQTPAQLALFLEKSNFHLRLRVLSEIQSRFHPSESQASRVALSNALKHCSEILETANREGQISILLDPDLKDSTEEDSLRLFNLNIAMTKSIADVRAVIARLQDNPHKRAVASTFWATGNEEQLQVLVNFCIADVYPKLGLDISKDRLQKIAHNLLFPTQEVSVTNLQNFLQIMVTPEFNDHFLLAGLIDSRVHSFETFVPQIFANHHLDQMRLKHPEAFAQIRKNSALDSVLSYILMKPGTTDLNNRTYRHKNKILPMNIPARLDEVEREIVVSFLNSPMFLEWKTMTGSEVDYQAVFATLYPPKQEIQVDPKKCAAFKRQLELSFPNENRISSNEVFLVNHLKQLSEDPVYAGKSQVELLHFLFHSYYPGLGNIDPILKCLENPESVSFFSETEELQKYYQVLLFALNNLKRVLSAIRDSSSLPILVKYLFSSPENIGTFKLFKLFYQMSLLGRYEFAKCVENNVPGFTPSNLFFHDNWHADTEVIEMVEFFVFFQNKQVHEWMFSQLEGVPMMVNPAAILSSFQNPKIFTELVKAKEWMLLSGLNKENQRLFFQLCKDGFRSDGDHYNEITKDLQDRNQFIEFLKNYKEYFTDVKLIQKCVHWLHYLDAKPARQLQN